MCNKIELYGVLFDNYDREKLTKRLKDFIFGFERGYLVTPNPYILEQSRKDSDLYEALCDALLCIADGVGVKIASRILGKGLLHRIPGIEIGEMVLSLCAENQKAVYLLGGADGVAAGASMALIDKYTGLLVAGYHHGYFSDCDSERIINLINESGAEVLYVCLGSPRQEKWIAENIENLPTNKEKLQAFMLCQACPVYRRFARCIFR